MEIKTVKTGFCVVGAGLSGICAAICAARLGVKVALINDRDVPGGNASSEHKIHVNGGATHNRTYYSREAGIADEIKQTVLHYNPRYNRKKDFHLNDAAILNMILSEPNIDYYPGTACTGCVTNNGKIIKATAFCARTGEMYEFIADNFCDASGDGILAYSAGCEYRFGREAKDEFNESLAPDIADDEVMASCALFTVSENDEDVDYHKPPFAYDFKKDGIYDLFNRPETGRNLPKTAGEYNGLWWLEIAGDTVKDAAKIDLDLKKMIYSFWDYIKNSGKYADAAKYSIDWVAPFASKRESRRFMAKYILTQNDIQNGTDFDDAVATGGWSLDVHDAGGIYGNGPTSAFGDVESQYNIPYRIMYSKDMDNLFLAGRIVSCTHIALGSIRVMETLAAMGHAVGAAAYLCDKYSTSPEGVENSYTDELRSTLARQGQYIMNMAEDCGKAANSRISSSGARMFENTKKELKMPLKYDVFLTLPTAQHCNDFVDVYVYNDSAKMQVLNFKQYAEKSMKNHVIGDEIGEKTVEIAPNFDGKVRLPLKTDGTKSFICLCKNENLGVYASDFRMVGAPCFKRCGNDVYKFDKDYRPLTVCFDSYENEPKLYAENNIINGYSRPVNLPNGFVCEKDGAYIELSFDEPVDVNEIQIYFNAEFETEHFNNPIEQMITAYDMTVIFDDGSTTVHVKDNYLSRNEHKICCKNVKKIRFDLIDNNGSPYFEVFAVKVF